MNPWITQRGYPIITIQRDPQNADGAILVQRPFISSVWTKSRYSFYNFGKLVKNICNLSLYAS